MTFDNSNRYTIAGSGANHLTMQTSSGPATITVSSGSHTIAAPITLMSDLSVAVTPAASILTMSGDLTATGKSVTKDGNGTAELKNVRASNLTINAGTVSVLNNGTSTGTSVLSGAPTIAGSAKLDLTNNSLIVNYTGASPAAAIRQLLINGRGPAGF